LADPQQGSATALTVVGSGNGYTASPLRNQRSGDSRLMAF
jgi:hypothetical protein